MSAFFRYASFPNSRNAQRSATKQASTFQVTIFDYTQPLTLLSPANLNRTYVTLKNLDLTNSMFYIYATTLAINPSVVATNGVPEQLIYNSGTNTLYQKQDYGLTTNWVVVAPQDVGMRIDAVQSATLDALEDVYGFANSGVPLVPDIVVDIDEGRG